MKITPKLLKHDARNVAYHEVSHYLVAKELGLYPATIEIWQLDGIENLREHLTVAGRVHFTPTTPYNTCMIGWGGLAGTVLSHQNFVSPRRLAQATLNHYQEAKQDQSGSFSKTDERAIGQENSLEARLAACEIVLNNRKELVSIAGEAVEHILKHGPAIRFYFPIYNIEDVLLQIFAKGPLIRNPSPDAE